MGSQRGIVMVYFIITWSIVVFLAVSRVEGYVNGAPLDPYFHAGCYKEDTDKRALPVLLANYSQNDQTNKDKVNSCAHKAESQKYQSFGLQNNGECWSGIDALFVYAKYGVDSSCTNGVGGVKANDVYILSLKFSHVGCYNEDQNDRAMPVLVANKTTSGPNLIQSCAREAWKRGFTKVFGLQDGGDCWSGNNADATYNKHGVAYGQCGSGDGTGGHLKIEVYRIDISVPTASVPQMTLTPSVITPTTEARNDFTNGIPYRHIGCFRDERDRAMPENLGSWPNGNVLSIERCAMLAWSKGYPVFGVQYDGRECWSGVNASITYAKYGNSTNCSNHIGGHWANDVYALVPCLPGNILQGSPKTCQPCSVDTYQQNINHCQPCEDGKKTWGRKAVASKDQCTAENPVKVSSLEVNIPFGDVKPGMIVANFNASFEPGSLVIPPLIYTITRVTRSPSQPRTSDVTSADLDSCSQPARNSSFPFCIYHGNGSIAINKNFNCSKGDMFVIGINVSDSGNDTIGTIINPGGRVTINCVNLCKDVRPLYEKARNACPNPNINAQINDTRHVVVNSTNIYSIKEINVTNIADHSCSTFNISMTHGLVNITSNIVFFGQTSVGYSFKNPIIVTGPVINITMRSNNCIESVSLTLETVPKQPESCDGRWECLNAVFNWTNSNNVGQRGSDPDNLRVRYGHCGVKPKIISGPESKNVPSGTPITLSCVVSSSLPVNITWYRGENEIPTNTVTLDVYNQGYYWCKASNGYGTARSGRALLVVSDYFTSITSFKLKNNNPLKIKQDPCQSCGHIADFLSGKDSSREYKHNPTCRYWMEWRNENDVECVIYGKKKEQDEDLDSYYRNLVEVLTEGAKKNKIEGLKVFWKSISVKDTGMCLNETTGKQNIKSFFIWEPTRIGSSATVSCPFGPPGLSATRRCGGNFNTGAVWDIPDDAKCSYKSKKTEEMENLSKSKLDPQNVNEAAKNFTKLFKSGSAKDMSEADANLAADMVENILSVEDRLNETADAVVEIIATMMDMNSSSLKANASSRIIKALDKVAEKIPLEGNTTSKVLTSSNLAIQANKVDATTFKGLGFGINKDGESGKSVVTNDEQSSLFVKLPKAVVENANKSHPTRIGNIYFANNILFAESDEEEDSENERKPSKEVLSSSVYNTNTSQLSENVTLSFPRQDEGRQNSSCVYWNEEARRWSAEGCSLCSHSDSDNEASVKCCCNHLTSFAVLFSPENKPLAAQDQKHAKILSIISYTGCGISLAGVVLTFITYSLFRHLRKTNQQPILMSLCVAMALLLIVFAVGVDRTSDQLGCQVVAVLLHYLTLATILWMGVEAYNLYLQLVKVMAIYHRKFMLKASLFAWGVPALIVTATVIAAVIQYNTNENSDRVFYYGNDDVCVLHDFTYRMVSWFVPILVTILFNLVMFVLVIYKLNCTGAMVPVDTKSNQKKRCWTALAIMSLLGITWLFGALAISGARLVFEYLFCIFNSLQGFFIFFFHCVRIKEVRNQWSFFVSGLGFSHKESETSRQRSRGIGESRHSSDAPYVKVKNWILRNESNSDQPKRKITVTTNIDDQNARSSVCDENKVDLELNEVRDIDPHENDALEDSGNSKRRDSSSSKSSSNP